MRGDAEPFATRACSATRVVASPILAYFEPSGHLSGDREGRKSHACSFSRHLLAMQEVVHAKTLPLLGQPKSRRADGPDAGLAQLVEQPPCKR